MPDIQISAQLNQAFSFVTPKGQHCSFPPIEYQLMTEVVLVHEKGFTRLVAEEGHVLVFIGSHLYLRPKYETQ